MGKAIIEVTGSDGAKAAISSSDIVFVQQMIAQEFPRSKNGSSAPDVRTVILLRHRETAITITGDHYSEITKAIQQEDITHG